MQIFARRFFDIDSHMVSGPTLDLRTNKNHVEECDMQNFHVNPVGKISVSKGGSLRLCVRRHAAHTGRRRSAGSGGKQIAQYRVRGQYGGRV